MKKSVLVFFAAIVVVRLYAQESASVGTSTTDVPAAEAVESDAASSETTTAAVSSAETDAVSTETEAASTETTAVATAETAAPAKTDGIKKAEGGTAVVPDERRPAAPDKDKCDAAAQNDDSPGNVQEYKDTLAYGVSPEITALLQKFIDNDDPRFSEEVYDLFQNTRSGDVRNKALEYFTHFKDPCLEHYCVTILNDPYDTNADTVSLVFRYVSAVKCTAAIPAVVTLMEANNDTYFQDALTTLGEIGGPSEALYLADYLDRDDLSLPQRQALTRVLGKIHALETWDKLAEMAKDENENSFIRMYAAESIGEMKKPESVPVLVKLYEETDPNLRQYVIKGLENYPDDKNAKAVIIQGIKDEHYKVRLESIDAAEKLSLKEAVPYLIYRAKNDKEQVVKKACYPAIAALDTKEGNDYLAGLLSGKDTSDGVKASAAEALAKDCNAGEKEMIALASETLKDDRRKQLRYAIGKQIVKYPRASYGIVCRDFLSSLDAVTVSLGLDMYKAGKYGEAQDAVRKIAEDKKSGGNGRKARKLLGLPEPDEKTKTSAAPAKPAETAAAATAGSSAAASSEDSAAAGKAE